MQNSQGGYDEDGSTAQTSVSLAAKISRLTEMLDQSRKLSKDIASELSGIPGSQPVTTPASTGVTGVQIEAGGLQEHFLANMSHELRTPLNAVLSLSRLLLREAGERLTSEQLEYLRVIERNGVRLLELISDLLELSLLESGQGTEKKHRQLLRDALGNLGSRIRERAQDKGVEFHLELPGEDVQIVVDENRLRSILSHLLDNAVKFTASGRIWLHVELAPDTLLLTVGDTGIGIDPELKARIFDAFRQLDAGAARRYGGIGLGLAVAAKHVQLLKGTMSVESQPEQGSRFLISLPVSWSVESPNNRPLAEAAESSAPPLSTEDDLITGGPADPHSPTEREPDNLHEGEVSGLVLLVEDNPDNRFTVQAILSGRYRVETAADGQQGLDKAFDLLPDVILLDMTLPRLSGYQVVRLLKADDRTRRIPVVALTARVMDGDREEILAAGCDEYLAKPVDVDTIRATVARCLSKGKE